MRSRTLYEILGVSETATPDEIKKAYRKKAMELHPDVGGDEEEFKMLNNAYHTLNDEQKRDAYRRSGNRPVTDNEELNELLEKLIIILLAYYFFSPSKRGFFSGRRRGFFNRFF